MCAKDRGDLAPSQAAQASKECADLRTNESSSTIKSQRTAGGGRQQKELREEGRDVAKAPNQLARVRQVNPDPN
jgi:hypothetical protein